MNSPAEIAAKHLEAWSLGQGPDTLRQHVEAAILEALAQDKALDDTRLFIPLTFHQEELAKLRQELAGMTAARNEAVEAAHLIAEGLR